MIEDAAKYIALDSPAAARRLAVEAVSAAESLSELSERGRVVPELNDSRYRELLVGSYRLVYRVEDQHVSIVAFVHGARDFRSCCGNAKAFFIKASATNTNWSGLVPLRQC